MNWQLKTSDSIDTAPITLYTAKKLIKSSIFLLDCTRLSQKPSEFRLTLCGRFIYSRHESAWAPEKTSRLMTVLKYDHIKIY